LLVVFGCIIIPAEMPNLRPEDTQEWIDPMSAIDRGILGPNHHTTLVIIAINTPAGSRPNPYANQESARSHQKLFVPTFFATKIVYYTPLPPIAITTVIVGILAFLIMMKTSRSTWSKAAVAVSSSSSSMSSMSLVSAAALLLLLLFPVATNAQCIADDKIDAEFRTLLGVDAIPKADSCCQADVCGIPCPAEVSDPKIGTFFF
jgi:hypothetical protein